MSGRVCVVGSLNMDLVVRVPRLPAAGETLRGSSFSTFLGGKGFNQAVAAARAGARTSMVGRVGDDEYGQLLRRQLVVESIEHSHVAVDAADGTGIALVMVEDSGENSIVIVPRGNAAMTVDNVRAARAVIEGCDVLLVQFEVPIDVVCEAARIARAAGVRVVVNPAPAPAGDVFAATDALVGLVDVVVPNMTEAGQLVDWAGGGSSPEERAIELRSRFGCDVVITLGGEGSVALDGAGLVRTPAFAVPVVDTVGAGDAFCGALGTWLADGASLREAVVFANAAGALAASAPGASPSMASRAAIRALSTR